MVQASDKLHKNLWDKFYIPVARDLGQPFLPMLPSTLFTTLFKQLNSTVYTTSKIIRP